MTLNVIYLGYKGAAVGNTECFRVNPDNTITTYINKLFEPRESARFAFDGIGDPCYDPHYKINKLFDDIQTKILVNIREKGVKPGTYDTKQPQIDINIKKMLINLIMDTDWNETKISEYIFNIFSDQF